MIYRELAGELLYTMGKLSRTPFQREPQAFFQGETGLLFLLEGMEKGTTAGVLSDSLGVSTGRITAALKNLEKKSLIRRRADIKDKRRVLVEITEEGRQLSAQKREEGLVRMEGLLRRLGKRDADELIRIMKRMTELSGLQ